MQLLGDRMTNGKAFRCPLHEDANPSGSLFADGNKAKCHSCGNVGDLHDWRDKINRLLPGTSFKESRASSNGTGRSVVSQEVYRTRRPPKVYASLNDAEAAAVRSVNDGTFGGHWDYQDERGEFAGRVVRIDLGGTDPTRDKPPKEFRPISKVAGGFAIRDPEGKWPIYNLPTIMAEPDGVVFFVEGEGVAEATQSTGLLVTTTAHGAGGIKRSDLSLLRGRKIVILPDNDDAGEKYAAEVSALLFDLGCDVKIVELPGLPPKGDVADLVDSRRSTDEIQEMIRVAVKAADPISAHPGRTSFASLAHRPQPMEKVAFHGVLGSIVERIAPHTEAAPEAILVQLLVAVGNAFGRGPYATAEADNHHTNLFTVLVGRTSRARKGTSFGHVRRSLEDVDRVWCGERIQTGLSTGEGMIWAVRDPASTKRDGEATDDGVTDKRLLAFAPEFASVLKVLERQGNTLSAVLRDAWDRGSLKTMTKNSPATATEAHVSVVGHITTPELKRYLTETESANGFANRFLWVFVERSKLLPDGGNLDPAALDTHHDCLKSAIQCAKNRGEVGRSEGFRSRWRDIYPELVADREGLFGAVTSRAEAQTLRLALVFALLDKAEVIDVDHLEAAHAVWKYCDESCRHIFGDNVGDAVADKILAGLRTSPQGLTRTEIVNFFNRKKKKYQIDAALKLLVERDKARVERQPSDGGRHTERWFAR